MKLNLFRGDRGEPKVLKGDSFDKQLTKPLKIKKGKKEREKLPSLQRGGVRILGGS